VAISDHSQQPGVRPQSPQRYLPATPRVNKSLPGQNRLVFMKAITSQSV